MATVHINDPEALIEQANNMAQYGQNILRVVEYLSGYSQKISNAWQSDTVDKETYLQSINKSIERITSLCAAMRSLSTQLINYAHKQIQSANSGTSS